MSEISFDELTDRYLLGRLEPGTLVRAPGSVAYLPPYDQPALRARGAPAPPASSPASASSPGRAFDVTEGLSFSDETKALSPEEAATLKELASQTEVAVPEPFEDRTPVRSAFDDLAPNSFFGSDDVEAAMRSFETVYSASASPASSTRRAPTPPPPSPMNADEPPSAASLLAQPSRTPPPAARVSSSPPLPPVPPSSRRGASADAGRSPGRSTPPRPPTPAPPSFGPSASTIPAPPAPRPAPSGFPVVASLSPLELPPPMAKEAASPTARRAARTGSRAPLALALVMLLLLGAAVLVALRKPELVRSLGVRFGGGGDAAPSAKPLDEAGAHSLLSAHAEQTFACAMADGPTGAGRVNVLVEASGTTASARVSAPFAGTPVGACLVRHFEMLTIPPFAGSPVVLQTTFVVPDPTTPARRDVFSE